MKNSESKVARACLVGYADALGHTSGLGVEGFVLVRVLTSSAWMQGGQGRRHGVKTEIAVVVLRRL